jgi:hypothetical protein
MKKAPAVNPALIPLTRAIGDIILAAKKLIFINQLKLGE